MKRRKHRYIPKSCTLEKVRLINIAIRWFVAKYEPISASFLLMKKLFKE